MFTHILLHLVVVQQLCLCVFAQVAQPMKVTSKKCLIAYALYRVVQCLWVCVVALALARTNLCQCMAYACAYALRGSCCPACGQPLAMYYLLSEDHMTGCACGMRYYSVAQHITFTNFVTLYHAYNLLTTDVYNMLTSPT